MKNILFLLLFTCVFTIAHTQSEIEKIKSTVVKSTIEGHIYFLASDELKGRETGTPEIDIAAEYLATSFRRYGVKSVPGAVDGYFQTVPFDQVSEATSVSLTLNGTNADDFVVIKRNNIDYTDEAIFVNYGLEKDYKNQNVSGKLVIALGGSEKANDIRSAIGMQEAKVELAKKNGAVGLVEIVSSDAQTWQYIQHRYSGPTMKLSQLTKQAKRPFTHVWLNTTESTSKKLTKGKINAELEITGVEQKQVFSKNVVGMVEGTDPQLKDEYVIYSAHYDHIGLGEPNAENDSIYNGARDNAVGTVTVMSAAENIAKYPTKRSALFILFTAEEKGLLGSQWYTEHPLIPLKQMVFCFNSDNGGYNDTSKATIVGLGRTTATEDIKKAATAFDLQAIDDPAPEQGLFDRSDNVHFATKGIPAPTFSLGFTAFDAEIMKYYHQTADNPETLDYDYLEKFFSAYVLSCRNIANNPETPFWTEGDKYFEAGQTLYQEK